MTVLKDTCQITHNFHEVSMAEWIKWWTLNLKVPGSSLGLFFFSEAAISTHLLRFYDLLTKKYTVVYIEKIKLNSIY